MSRGKLLSNRDRRGAAVVEMALILPVFFMVILGIVEFGRAMMVAQIVTNAAREGAREAILSGSTNQSISDQVAAYLKETCQVAASDVTVTITIVPHSSNPDPLNVLANALEGDQVTVKVSVPFNSVSYLTGSYLGGKNLIGQATMRHE